MHPAILPSASPPATPARTVPGDADWGTGTADLGEASQLSSEAAASWTGPHCLAGTGNIEATLRRGLDVVLSVIALLFCLPLLATIGVAVAATSRGPVLYRQDRVGLNGRLFQMIKFRSMRVDAEVSGAQWAAKSDTRVTLLGRVLRLTRLDELPQLFNVLAGSMSLVGPRPERPMFVAQLSAVIPFFEDRTLVRPGLTGWAQVNYPYGASVEDARRKLAYDLYYLQHRSLWLDVKILLRTVGVVCTLSGAR